MLPKQYRLPVGVSFQNARSATTPHFSFRWISTENSQNRYGFIVSKKVDSRAVMRNRAKRMLRQCVEQYQDSMAVSYDFLFTVRKNFVNFTLKQLEEEFVDVLTQNNLLK
ncbi:MAG TPA: ribonuclease P protein component [Patescibacteria group bacterium]|nr:ribonuclease P protein component [Patescibacteria group bacterium]